MSDTAEAVGFPQPQRRDGRSPPTRPVGDKGQRYEVRYRENAEMIGNYQVLGWAASRSGARKMVKVWLKKPGVRKCWIYDRQEKQQRGHWK